MLQHIKQSQLRLALTAAAIGATLFTSAAHAQMVVRDFSAAPIVIPFTTSGLYINVVSQATGTSGGSVAGWDINPFIGGPAGGPNTFNLFTPGGIGGFVGAAGSATPLAAGTLINASSTFLPNVVGTSVAAGTQFYGFRFLNGTGTTATTHYGYVQFNRTLPLAPGSIQLVGYAFNATPLTAVTVSPIPEPSSALLMLAGLAAAGGLMRKRLAAKA